MEISREELLENVVYDNYSQKNDVMPDSTTPTSTPDASPHGKLIQKQKRSR